MILVEGLACGVKVSVSSGAMAFGGRSFNNSIAGGFLPALELSKQGWAPTAGQDSHIIEIVLHVLDLVWVVVWLRTKARSPGLSRARG